MRDDNRKAEIIAFAVFVVPLIYIGLKIVSKSHQKSIRTHALQPICIYLLEVPPSR